VVEFLYRVVIHYRLEDPQDYLFVGLLEGWTCRTSGAFGYIMGLMGNCATLDPRLLVFGSILFEKP
jgi:hypothetical protein